MIRAEAHSDDYKATAKFDATPWFAQASDDSILQLARQEWGGDYAADAVAHHLGEEEGYEQLAAMFAYLDGRPQKPNGETVGFEVHIHRGDAVRWLIENRREVFAAVAKIEKLDAGQERHLASTAPQDPDWESDSSWKGVGYDEPQRSAPMPG
jgi:hypothetical protein